VEVQLKKMTAEENERSRYVLLSDEGGKKRIAEICKVLHELESELNNAGNNDALYGKADCFLMEIEELIRSCGLYRSKAKNLSLCAKRLTEVYGGEVPSAMEDLLTLPGVGRKVANLIRGDVFGLGGIVADTHCIRITNLLGFCSTDDPKKVEFTLDPLVPKEQQSDFCHRLVQYGRDICIARRPNCGECVLKDLCKHGESL
jgi:endonuclease-3